MKKPIVTAMLAYGMSGKVFHAPFLNTNAGFELYGVLERTAKKAAIEYPKIKSFDTVESLLQDPKIELVVVNTPNNLHFEHAKMVLKSVKNVLLEKPATATLADFEALLDIAKTVGKQIFVYQNRRFSSDFLALKKVIESGKLGDIIELHLRFDRYRNTIGVKTFKETKIAGSGIWYDLGAHLVDQAISLFGKPKTFSVTKNSYRENSKVDDYAAAHLVFDNNINVFITVSMLVLEAQPGIVIHGTKGSFVKHFCDQQEQQLIDGILPTDDNFGFEPPKHEGILTYIDSRNQKIIEVVDVAKGNFNKVFDSIYENLRENKDFLIDNQDIKYQISILES